MLSGRKPGPSKTPPFGPSHATKLPPYSRRGELYPARLDKVRPVIILSVDSLHKYAFDICVIPVTTQEHRKFSMRVHLRAGDGGITRDCWAKCDQVTTLEKEMLQYPALGFLCAEKFERVQEQVKISLDLL
ncbi:MAG: type II toxin-antitoxin system PemK/MazF family toxin [Terriglobia bacterium]